MILTEKHTDRQMAQNENYFEDLETPRTLYKKTKLKKCIDIVRNHKVINTLRVKKNC